MEFHSHHFTLSNISTQGNYLSVSAFSFIQISITLDVYYTLKPFKK